MPVGTRWSQQRRMSALLVVAAVVVGIVGARTGRRADGHHDLRPRGHEAMLTPSANLDCPFRYRAAVVIENGHLDLGGFTIRWRRSTASSAAATPGETINGDELYKYGSAASLTVRSPIRPWSASMPAPVELTDVTIAPAPEAIVRHRHFPADALRQRRPCSCPATVAAGIFGS